jgi:hypothetical protein
VVHEAWSGGRIPSPHDRASSGPESTVAIVPTTNSTVPDTTLVTDLAVVIMARAIVVVAHTAIDAGPASAPKCNDTKSTGHPRR